MSNFTCEHCGTVCHDTPDGYITGCEHYPADEDKNQCDGCKRGLRSAKGIHQERDGRPYMVCSRSRYL